jgi:oxygen-independent coproporphyrinogen-3 oxidase
MMEKLGLYLHIPFCASKCAYCDFLSGPAGKEEQARYVEALIKEIKSFSSLKHNYQVDTVFFGGGTPSILEPELFLDAMEALGETFAFTKSAELTVEANPGTLTKNKLLTYKKTGINRLSIGLQSGDNDELKRLGRIHTWEEFLENYHLAREVGFKNINVDLMLALPGQTTVCLEESLKKVLALTPEHISVYSLILEEGTPFFEAWEKGELTLPEEETERGMYYLTVERLEQAGYHRYEISNFSKEGFESRHNNKYWTGDDYLGLGVASSSYLKGCRMKNTENILEYREKIEDKKSPIKERQTLTRQEKIEEFMFLGLRRSEGISKEKFFEKFEASLSEVYGSVIEKQEKLGLISQDEKRLWLTKRGIDVSNQVMADYLF